MTEEDRCTLNAALFDFRVHNPSEHKQQQLSCTYRDGRKWEEPFDGQIPRAGPVATFVFLFST